MNNMSANTSSNDTSSPYVVDLPSRTEGIVVCSAYVFEAVFIVGGNLLTIFLFVFQKKLRKKSLLLVINMAFADAMLGAIALPLFVFVSVGLEYKLWSIAKEVDVPVGIFWGLCDSIFSMASLISAVFISCERFYAIYWPLKHRTLSMRAYRIVLFMVWLLAILVYSVHTIALYLNSLKTAISSWVAFPLIFLFIVCGCNIGIWRKFRQSGNIASQQHNRALQNQRLTKTLLFVSFIAVLTWFPLVTTNYLIVVHGFTRRNWVYCTIVILYYSNSFFNTVVYALKIPEFRESLNVCCARRQPAMMYREDRKERDSTAAAFSLVMIQPRMLETNPGHLHQAFEQEVVDTKL